MGALLIFAIGYCSNLYANTSVYEDCGKNESTSPFLQAVETFAGNVLKNGGDQYGDTHSPLFVDGIFVIDGESVRWKFYEDESWIISNLAGQQNLMRVLYGLSELTGEECYRKTVADAVKYLFDHQSGTNGLHFWGGHQFVDLQTMQNQFQSRPPKLKNHFLFYEFMWEVDSDATFKMLEVYRTTRKDHYLELAEVIGINILDEHFIKGYFLPSENHMYTRFDSPESLALLHLVTTRKGKSHLVPAYLTGTGETDGENFLKELKEDLPAVRFMSVR